MEEIAYYYPAPYWASGESGWVKSLLLFFDRIGILLPDYMHGRHLVADPSLAHPLEQRGLLEVLEPRDWVSQGTTEQLASVVVELLTAGAFDELPRDVYFAELSQSRMGYGADVQLADMLVEELQAKGLARPSEDGVSIPLHPVVRTSILVILAQLARNEGLVRGLRVHPATSNVTAIRDLMKILSLPTLPSAGHVVAMDLETVTLNLDLVPLDDVIAYREEHASQHRKYIRDVQGLAAQLAIVDDEEERERLFVERSEELAENANDLKRLARRSFRKRLGSWSLGLAGGVWALAASDPLGVVLGAASQALDLLPSMNHVTAYSYVFGAQDDLSRPS